MYIFILAQIVEPRQQGQSLTEERNKRNTHQRRRTETVLTICRTISPGRPDHLWRHHLINVWSEQQRQLEHNKEKLIIIIINDIKEIYEWPLTMSASESCGTEREEQIQQKNESQLRPGVGQLSTLRNSKTRNEQKRNRYWWLAVLITSI